MLTILWRKPDGSEMLFTAESIERISGSEAQVPAGGGFIARGVNNSEIPGDEFRFNIGRPFGAVFVMNDKGCTVARYMASPPQQVERAPTELVDA